MKLRKFYINTIGCQMNVYDSAQMASVLKQKNYQPCDSFLTADLIIVNTCAIREKAEQKVYSFLGRLTPLKKKNPGLKVVVAGCVAQQQGVRITERFPQVDLVLGTHMVHRLPEFLEAIEAAAQPLIETGMTKTIGEPASAIEKQASGHDVSAFVTIMRGCDNYCTYCVVPYVRGREISRRPESILGEIRALVAVGVREITLLGQNVNSYGVKEGMTSFPELLTMVNDIEGLERIRFVTSHPKDLSDDLVSAFGNLEKLCNHIHLPVQSGSDRILKKMNRRYTRSEYLEKIDKLRRVSPDIAITTDFIVGFPGETDADFLDTLTLMETVQYDTAFAFEYSDRHEAPASRFSDKISGPVKNERVQRLFALQKEITRKNRRLLEGKVFSALIEGESRNQLKKSGTSAAVQLAGRTSENRIVNFDFPCHWGIDFDLLKGQTVNVEIVDVLSNSLRGVLTRRQIEYLKSKGGHSHVA
ncbi:MAG: tRNA (N6-isopentenyl adenosine(37)-C2)-methylthiotransferase MiaB [Desulfobacterales bacterium CG23_combo_of_CG06-09_8_20_14_all_51_8]|nr:MAG: tRNA (N6-isopentenyl adenosine(37)-C2)-methylthiotransferase MiaB [Desulfobacterales bacterium CG23_combo_of_CG06-09_8_20_14_all_51_8]